MSVPWTRWIACHNLRQTEHVVKSRSAVRPILRKTDRTYVRKWRVGVTCRRSFFFFFYRFLFICLAKIYRYMRSIWCDDNLWRESKVKRWISGAWCNLKNDCRNSPFRWHWKKRKNLLERERERERCFQEVANRQGKGGTQGQVAEANWRMCDRGHWSSMKYLRMIIDHFARVRFS